MRVAIMQPYIFPYIGYFQLIAAVDVFVFYDDVNFIKKGFINRNYFLYEGNAKRFTIPCLQASQNKHIKDITIDADSKAIPKFIASLEQSYKQAPYFDDIMPLIQSVFQRDLNGLSISELAIISVKTACQYLGITTDFKQSSVDFSDTQNLEASKRLMRISKLLGGDIYINPSGGKVLYDKASFKAQEVSLKFLESSVIKYSQFQAEFVPYLSIIDVMMFNSVSEIQAYLNAYTLT